MVSISKRAQPKCTMWYRSDVCPGDLCSHLVSNLPKKANDWENEELIKKLRLEFGENKPGE